MDTAETSRRANESAQVCDDLGREGSVEGSTVSVHVSRGLLNGGLQCRYHPGAKFRLVDADKALFKLGIHKLNGTVKRKIYRCRCKDCPTVFPGPEEVRECGAAINLVYISPWE